MATLILAIRIVLAGVFATAGVAKLFDLRGSREALGGFGFPARLVPAAAVALPLVEIAIALALIPTDTAPWAAIAAVALLLAFIAGITNAMRQGEAPDCHCFGQIHSAPAGRGTLMRNAVLAALAVPVIVDGGPSLTGWLSDRSDLELVAVAGGATSAVLGALCVRLWLDRRDLRLKLDDALRHAGAPGLPVSAAAPEFSLTDLEGRTRTLNELTAPGLPVALFFVASDCDPCHRLLPDLGKWQATLSDRLTVAIVTRGTADEVRAAAEEHGLRNVLLQEDMEVMKAYRLTATPTAVIVAPDQTIASQSVSSLISIEPLIRLTLRRTESGGPEPDRAGSFPA